MATFLTDPLEVVPTVGMSGLFSLKAPYTNLVREQIEYTCIQVINLTGALAQGDDPKTDVYLANGDTEENYNLDLAANHCIVTLQSELGDVVVVPNGALNGLPIADGVKYMSAVLGISLSALPEDFDLTQLKQDISDLVFETIGVRSTVYPATIGGTIVLSHEEHAGIEAARLANVQLTPSNLTLVTQLQNEKIALQAKLTQLEDYLKAHLP